MSDVSIIIITTKEITMTDFQIKANATFDRYSAITAPRNGEADKMHNALANQLMLALLGLGALSCTIMTTLAMM